MRKLVMLISVIVFITFSLIFQQPLLAGGFIVSGPEKGQWSPKVQEVSFERNPFPAGFDPFQLRLMSENVTVNIEGGVANVEVVHKFHSMRSDKITGHFYFPLPQNAIITDFKIKDEGQTYLPKKYDQDMSEMVFTDLMELSSIPAFWEYTDKELYSLAIFEFNPGTSREIVVSYKQKVAQDGDVSFLYPVKSQKMLPKPVGQFKMGIDIIDSLRIMNFVQTGANFVRKATDTGVELDYSASDVKMVQDVGFSYKASEEDFTYSIFTQRKKDGYGYFMMTLDKGISKEKPLNKDMLFIVDASDYMLERETIVKDALNNCIKKLNNGDRFNVISYNKEAKSAFKGWESATAGNKGKAAGFVKSMAVGGEECDVSAAFDIAKGLEPDGTKPMIVMFISAGSPNAGRVDVEEEMWEVFTRHIIANPNVRVFPVGIGTKVNTYLMDGMASGTKAKTTYVSKDGLIKQSILDLFNVINNPVMNNIQLHFSETLDLEEVYPRTIQSLMFRGEPLVITGRYKIGAGRMTLSGEVHGKTKRYEIKSKLNNAEINYPFVARFWATRAIGYKLEEIELQGSDADLINEISNIARENAIYTPLTMHFLIREVKDMDEGQKKNLGRLFKVDGKEYSKLYRSLRSKTGKNVVRACTEIQYMKNITDPTQANYGQDSLYYENDMGDLRQGVSGEYIFLNDRPVFKIREGVWVDSSVPKAKGKATRLEYGSDTFFKLLKSSPEAFEFLTLGGNVTFVVDDKIYQMNPNAQSSGNRDKMLADKDKRKKKKAVKSKDKDEMISDKDEEEDIEEEDAPDDDE